jgi:acetoin utilization deacetylase AcuC-like enzyme
MDKFWRAWEMIRAECPSARITRGARSGAPTLARSYGLLPDQYSHGDAEPRRSGSAGIAAMRGSAYPLAARNGRYCGGNVGAIEGGLACNLAGGTHHAFRDRGLGYCVLNDVAVAIRDLHVIHPQRRVFVIDTDAHQGNGSNSIFAGDERVFTYSIHVGRNYPAEKTAGSLDVELPRFVSGAEYLARLNATLPAALQQFAPDLAFWIAGSDPHENDRFGQMKLSDADMATRDSAVLDLVTRLGIPTSVLYGGGYNRDRVHTARLHANTVKLTENFWRWNAGAAQDRAL